MSEDPTGTQNIDPALRLIVTTVAQAAPSSTPDPTGTQNVAPALRLIVPPPIQL